MEIDTGASALIISEEIRGKLWTNEKTPASSESSVNLRRYTGEIIPVVGAVKKLKLICSLSKEPARACWDGIGLLKFS